MRIIWGAQHLHPSLLRNVVLTDMLTQLDCRRTYLQSFGLQACHVLHVWQSKLKDYKRHAPTSNRLRQGRVHVHLQARQEPEQASAILKQNKLMGNHHVKLSSSAVLQCFGGQAQLLQMQRTVRRKNWLQRTMPYDMTSRILAGFRLVTTTTLLFCIWSTGTNLTKPLTTWISSNGSLSFLLPLPNTSRCSDTTPAVKKLYGSIKVWQVHQWYCHICRRWLHLCKVRLYLGLSFLDSLHLQCHPLCIPLTQRR